MTQDIDVAIIISDNRTKKKTSQIAVCKVDTIDKFFWAFQSLFVI